ncbi:alpha-2-macroglobulin-like isoform X2 [Penaeus japonicus]|uniref:alpha-2-macroglobulin-like isoform X2 n=1 Tax=Penaeus japonicus TaxID=27405 RepID=UPI001C713BCD|nr:alpha-2-macroglobulin-like isoform X2 [Penaeus japonicus]
MGGRLPLSMGSLGLLALCVATFGGVGTASLTDHGPDDVTASQGPLDVSVSFPSLVKLGEILTVKVSLSNHANQTMFAIATINNTRQNTCLLASNSVDLSFQIQPQVVGTIFISLEVEMKRQRTLTCKERSKDSGFVHFSLLNATVEAEGFRREKTTTKYVCGSDDLEGLPMEAPPEAVDGSVSAWLSASTTYMAVVVKNMKKLLPHGRGDLVSLDAAAKVYLLEALLQEHQELKLLEMFYDNMAADYKRQLQYRLEDDSYTTLASRDRAVSSWMTAYMLTVASVSSNYSAMRQTWRRQRDLQRKEDEEDGCFDWIGEVYDDQLKDKFSGKVSRVLLTAYKIISVCISGQGGPPDVYPFRGRDCLVQHSSKDPFTLAIKACALSCTRMPEAKTMLDELLSQAVETEKYIYWDLPAGSDVEKIRVTSYAALAIMGPYYSSYEHKLTKMMRWLVEHMNSQGGFYSVFDTMMAMRSLVFFDTRPLKHDVNVAVLARDTNRTLHFDAEHRFQVQRVELPALPTNVSFTASGSGCAIVQSVVQYNAREHYRSNAFSLSVTSEWNPNIICNRPHYISVCAASLLNKTSNLVAVEVRLVSGFAPREKDLEEIVRPAHSAFARYEMKGSRVTFYAGGLTAEDSCLEFEVVREMDVGNAKPGVVLVYDYYQPEVAVSKSYSLSSSSECPSVRHALNTYRNTVPRNGEKVPPKEPFSVRIDLPSHAKVGEVLPIKITTESHLNLTLFVTAMVDTAAQYEILQDASQTNTNRTGERSTCLEARGKTTDTFKIRPLVAEVINVTVGVGVNRQEGSSCADADSDLSDYIYVSLLNITIEPDGFQREKTWAKYVCGPDMLSGQDTLQDWQVEAPPEAVQGSVKAWLIAASNFMAIMQQDRDSLLLHKRGDIEGLNTAANQYLYLNFLGSNRYRNESYDDILSNVKEGYERQRPYRLEDDSYAVFGSRNKEVSSWMTSYILTTAALTSQRRITRPTWNWLNTLQRDAKDQDGCFDHVGKVYHNGLKDEATGAVSRILLTAYTMVSLGISAWDGPPHINPFKARECILQHRSTDPFTLAIKAHALGVTFSDEKYIVLAELFKQATKTAEYMYWDIPNDKAGTNSEAVQIASYAAMAIMTSDNERKFESELDKIIRWLAVQANSRGGFNSIFDTMMGVRALLYYERRAFEFDVQAEVVAEGVNRTFTFSRENFRRVQLVDLPVLPTSVKSDVAGSGCAFLQAVVQYSVNDHYNTEDFSLSLSTNTDASDCSVNRINFCTAYLPSKPSNLVAVEVSLVSGYTPLKEDLEGLVNSTDSLFTEYEIKGNRVVLYVDGLSAEESCADFGVVRELEVEDAKPGVVVVYDYYQPEIAASANYRLSTPAAQCTSA